MTQLKRIIFTTQTKWYGFWSFLLLLFRLPTCSPLHHTARAPSILLNISNELNEQRVYSLLPRQIEVSHRFPPLLLIIISNILPKFSVRLKISHKWIVINELRCIATKNKNVDEERNGVSYIHKLVNSYDFRLSQLEIVIMNLINF